MKKIICLLLIPLTLGMSCKESKKHTTEKEKQEIQQIDPQLANQMQISKDCLMLQQESWNSPKGEIFTFSLAALPMEVEHPTFMDGFTILIERKDLSKSISLPQGAGGYAQGSKMSIITDPNQEMPFVLITTESGGSGGYREFYLYDLNQEEQPLLAQSEEFIKKLGITGKFLDNFSTELTLENVGTYTLSMEKDKDFLLETKAYDKEGNLLNREATPWIGGFWSVDCSIDAGQPMLHLTQPIIGIAHAQKVGTFDTEWIFTNGSWTLKKAGVSDLKK